MTAPEASEPAKIADVLVLVPSPGSGIVGWAELGTIERELAIYKHLHRQFGTMVVVSESDSDETRVAEEIAEHLGDEPIVLGNPERLERSAWLAALPERLVEAVADFDKIETAVVKTDQHLASEAALSVTETLRRRGVRTGLVARGGYLWSRFEAEIHGPDTRVAIEAADRERELCQAADVVVGSTQGMLDDIAWRYSVRRDRLRLIPNYVTDTSERIGPEGRLPRTLLAVGQLAERKRLDLIVRTAARINREWNDAVDVVFIGVGPEADRLAKLASQLDVSLTLRGAVSHAGVLEAMRSCTVFVQASSLEGHPKSVIEAMAAGCPVVVAASPGLGDVVRHGVNGLRLDPNVETFADAIGPLLADAAWRDAMGAAAMANTRSSLGLSRIAELETEAWRDAIEIGQQQSASPLPPVRWSAELLQADTTSAVDAWRNSLHGFAKRLDAGERARLLASLEPWVVSMMGEAARDAQGGLHPKHRLTGYHDFFAERLTADDRVLDLGCGVCALAATIAAETGAHVTGIDLDPAELATARKVLDRAGVSDRVTLIESDITATRAEGTFSAIVLSNVLEHLRDRPELLAKWREWYGCDRFLIRVPAYDRDWTVPWKDELGVDPRLDHTHEIEYRIEDVHAEVEAAGLELSELIVRWGEYWFVAQVPAAEEATQHDADRMRAFRQVRPSA
ncbi:MAG: glycosyltransferase [Planctomycetota bacterium]